MKALEIVEFGYGIEEVNNEAGFNEANFLFYIENEIKDAKTKLEALKDNLYQEIPEPETEEYQIDRLSTWLDNVDVKLNKSDHAFKSFISRHEGAIYLNTVLLESSLIKPKHKLRAKKIKRLRDELDEVKKTIREIKSTLYYAQLLLEEDKENDR